MTVSLEPRLSVPDFVSQLRSCETKSGTESLGSRLGDGSVAGEGRVVGVPKFHSWGKCTMPLTNTNSDWMSNASSGLCIILVYVIVILRAK